jgi:hypothetical protein
MRLATIAKRGKTDSIVLLVQMRFLKDFFATMKGSKMRYSFNAKRGYFLGLAVRIVKNAPLILMALRDQNSRGLF